MHAGFIPRKDGIVGRLGHDHEQGLDNESKFVQNHIISYHADKKKKKQAGGCCMHAEGVKGQEKKHYNVY